MPAPSNQNLVSRLNALMREVGSTKQATELGLTGSAKDEGDSSHPSAKVDNNLMAPSLGELAHDNEKRIKEDQPGGGVDSANKNETGTHDSKAIAVGMKPSATGEDPAIEDNYKDKKDDPGTSHPAEAGEEKYASLSLSQLVKLANSKIDDVLADFEKEAHLNYYGEVLQKKASAKPSQETKVAADQGKAVAQQAIANTSFDKNAYAQQLIAQELAAVDHAADLVGQWLHKAAEYRRKMAESADPMAADSGEPEKKSPEEEGGADKGAPKTTPEQMAGADIPADMAGDAGAGAGGGEPDEAAVNELFNALAQLGIPPEALLQAAQHAEGGAGGGMGGGMPPMDAGAAAGGGAMPPVDPAAMGGADIPKMASAIKAGGQKYGIQNIKDLRKFASAACKLQKAGKVRIVRHKPGTKQAEERNEIVRYLEEMCGAR